MAFGSAYKKASAVCVTVLFAFCAGQPVWAQQNRNNNPTQKELLITEAWVDFGNNEIMIKGVNFDNGDTPVVVLGDDPTPLALNSYTPTEILAVLPPVPDGDYLLTVSTGPAVKDYDEYDLTIGAAGPEGPQGPQGLQGPVGQQGPKGISGYQIVTNVVDIPADSVNQYFASCPAGKKVLGGGVKVQGNSEATIFGSSPTGDNSWLGEVLNINRDATMTVYAICAYVD